jgi:hypothetical protein
LRLDFEKGPIHPSPLGPSILSKVYIYLNLRDILGYR